MMDIPTIVQRLRHMPNCRLFEPAGFPILTDGDGFPQDLKVFYTLGGGALLFENAVFPTEIASPSKFVRANPVIFSGVAEHDLAATQHDISWSWYVIAYGLNAQYITLDLAPARLGQCYDSKWDRHPRNSPIIARSFTDLLLGLLSTNGEYDYWDDLGFKLGSPYALPE
jgi:antitoxin YokJ